MKNHHDLLKLESIHRSYTLGGTIHKVLQGVNLEVPPGTLVGLLGESGSGKTTLARIITGIEAPDYGSVFWEGSSLPSLRRRRFQQVADIQYIFQDPYAAFNPLYTVEHALKEPLKYCRRHKRLNYLEIAEALDKVGLPPDKWLSRRLGALSGGERQRAAIARALIPLPRFLIADESTSMLDNNSAEFILEVFNNLNKEFGMSILFITHQVHVIKQSCRTLYLLNKGRVVEKGDTRQVLTQPSHPYARQMVKSLQYFEEVGAVV